MKHALAIYIDFLAVYAEHYGRLPAGAASDAALREVWESLRVDLGNALEAAIAKAAAEEIGRTLNVQRSTLNAQGKAALDAETGFGPIPEAVEALRRKTVVASTMRSAEWALAPAEIRNVSQFSAGVASARVMGAVQERLVSDMSWDFRQPKGREAFIRDMREVMQAEGIGTTATGEGSLTNPQANSRLGLIFDQQSRSAAAYANYRMGLDPDMLDAVPCGELYRMAEPKGGPSARRDWRRRWTDAGGKLYGGRMIALKTDPVWTDISRFGQPWPPFDFGSHMGVRDVFRAEAEELGVIAPAAPAMPDERRFDGRVSASAENVPEAMRGWLKESFGDRIEFDGDTARWTAARSATREEADAWGRTALGGARIPQEERQALLDYQDRVTHAKVNIGLRAGIETPESKRIEAAIGRARLHQPAVVWRAEDAGYLGADGVSRYQGRTISQPAFLSTAFSREESEKGYASNAENPILYEIYVPKGAKAVYMNAATNGRSRYAKETELLIQRGARIYVRGLERSRLSDGREVIIVKSEVLP